MSFAAATIGTETGGSIIGPSSVSGIVGMKPAIALVRRRGIVPISLNQDSSGPMTRTVRDVAMILDVIAGTDPDDPWTAEADANKADYVAALDTEALRAARLGFLRPSGGRAEATGPLFDAALAVLRAEGAELVEIPAVELVDPRLEMQVILLHDSRSTMAAPDGRFEPAPWRFQARRLPSNEPGFVRVRPAPPPGGASRALSTVLGARLRQLCLIVGGFLDVQTPLSWLTAGAELAYTQRGSDVLLDVGGVPATGGIRTDYLTFAVRVRAALALGPVRVHTAAGPISDIAVRSRLDPLLIQVLDEEKAVEFGVAAGAGVGAWVTERAFVELEARLVEGLQSAYAGDLISARNRSRELVARVGWFVGGQP